MSRIPRPAALAMALMAHLAAALLPLGAEQAAERSGFAAHLRAFGLIGRRTEGSEAERAALAYIRDRCASLGVRQKTQSLDSLEADHSYSSILTASLPGPGSDLLVFVVPLDCHADAPSGEGDAGLALALAEIENLAAEKRSGRGAALSVDFVFLGAERRGRTADGATSGPGARWWIDNLDESRATAVVYLSLDTLPGALVLRNAIAGTLSPYWFYERTRLALAASGFDYRLEPNRMQGYRLGLLERPGPLLPFLAAGIPAVELRSEGARVALADPSPPFANLVHRLTDGSSGAFLDTWDRDYSTFQLGSFSFVVKEGPFVVFLLCFVAFAGALLLVLSITRREVLLRFATKLPRRLAYVGILALVSVLALLSMRLGLIVESSILGTVEVWKARPGLFLAGRLLVLLFSFLGLSSWAVSRRLLSPDPLFYEVAALFLLGIDILLFAFLSLPLSLYFCWGFAVALGAVFLRRGWASLLALVLLYLPFTLLAREMLSTPEYSALGALIVPSAGKGTLLALVLLPFAALTASPLLFFAPRGRKRRRIAAAVFLGLALGVEAALIALSLLGAAREPLRVSETFDQDTASYDLSVDSFARLGRIEFLREGGAVGLSTTAVHGLIQGRDDRRLISMDLARRDFLDRRTWNLRLSFIRPPASLSLRLVSDKPMTIYDCSYPYKVDLDGLGASIFVGPGGPLPLDLELTTGTDFAARLRVEASYDTTIGNYEARGGGRALLLEPSLLKASFAIAGAAP